MTPRTMLVVLLFMIGLLGTATWILATFTIGEALAPEHPVVAGFATALLVVITAVYLLLFSDINEKPGSRFGVGLVVCGTACVLISVVPQCYLIFVVTQNTGRMASVLNESLRHGDGSANANWSFNLPSSVSGVSYLALLFGAWMTVIGIRVLAGETFLKPVVKAVARQAPTANNSLHSADL